MSYADELLKTLRTHLVTVPTLPAARHWGNTTPESVPTAMAVVDMFATLSSEYRECGPDAGRRTEVVYVVSVLAPLGGDLLAALAVAGEISASFAGAALSVSGNVLELLGTRIGPSLREEQQYNVPVYLSFTFDHP